MSYEGLPFVSRSRLHQFLGAKGTADQDEAPSAAAARHARDMWAVRSFLREFFQAQEEAYHVLLDLVGKVSFHRDYWLDWTTPVHRQPLWAYRIARRACAGYLALLGRAEQTAVPSLAARQFSQLHVELCRLVAYVKVSSFELLGYEDNFEDLYLEAMRQAAEHLACQARNLRSLASALGSDESSCRRPVGAAAAAKPAAAKPARLSAAFPGLDADQAMGELDWEGRKHLEESRLAILKLSGSLTAFMQRTGRLKHISKIWPLYVLGALGAAFWASVHLRDGAARAAFREHTVGVCRQFYREWVRDPLEMFCTELFRHLTKEDTLVVQLKELRAEQQALGRMLEDFVKIVTNDPDPKFQVNSSSDMHDLAERYFEWSLEHPVTNALNGHLMGSCMVQSQRMKVLLYASLYSIDAVLAQLKWDFLMAGFMPLMSLCGLGCWCASSYKRRHLLGWRRKMVRALAEVDRFLNLHVRSLQPQVHSSGNLNALAESPRRRFLIGGYQLLEGHTSVSSGTMLRHRHSSSDIGELSKELDLDKVGAVLSQLDALCRLASRFLEGTDWRTFRHDILALTSPELSVAQKLRIVDMMRNIYSVFHLVD